MSFADDVRKVRMLQDEWADTSRIADELEGEIAKLDRQIGVLEDARDEAEDNLREQRERLAEIDAELGGYSQDVIDEAD